MINTFDQHWPVSVPLRVYAEDCAPLQPSPRVEVLDLHASSPDLVNFKQRHSKNPVANGTVAKDTSVPFRDNNFKWDAVRFSNKVFAVIHAASTVKTHWMIWLDADTVTFRDVPQDLLPRICDDTAMACYLGRQEKYHSECGWVAYNLRHAHTQEFMSQWRDLYVHDQLFDLREYHDSFLFDELRRRFQSQHGTKFHNMTPVSGKKGPGHPFIASELGRYMDHLKGDVRKDLGRSRHSKDAESYAVHQDLEYWR
jgi:hypothetical protein